MLVVVIQPNTLSTLELTSAGSTLRKAMHARTALGKALWQELRGTIGELEAKVGQLSAIPQVPSPDA